MFAIRGWRWNVNCHSVWVEHYNKHNIIPLSPQDRTSRDFCFHFLDIFRRSSVSDLIFKALLIMTQSLSLSLSLSDIKSYRLLLLHQIFNLYWSQIKQDVSDHSFTRWSSLSHLIGIWPRSMQCAQTDQTITGVFSWLYLS